METLDFSCSPRKREEVDGKALASDKTVPSLSLFRSSPSFFPRVLLSPLLPRSAASHFCRAFKYCARKFDPLWKVQRLTGGAGEKKTTKKKRSADGTGKRM